MRALATVFLLFAPQLPSQIEVSIPADSLIVVSMDGPAKLGAAFANTRIAQLLTNPRMGALMTPLTMGIDMGIRQLEQETGEDVQLLYETVMGYEGRITVAMSFLSKDQDMPALGPPPFGFLVVVSPDGDIDLESLGEDLTDLIEQNSDTPFQDLRVEGETYRTSMEQDGAGTTLPMMIGKDLVLIAGAPLEDTISHFTSGQGRDSFEAPNGFAAAPLAMRVDLEQFLSLALEAGMSGAMAVTDPMQAMMMREMVGDMLNAIGVSALEKLDLVLGTLEDHVIVDMSMGLKPTNRGFFELIIPERAGPPATMNLVPRQAPMWSVIPVRFDRVHDVLAQIVNGLESTTGMTMAQVDQEIEASVGLRLKEDILDHLDNSALSVTSSQYLTNVLVNESEAGSCYAFTLKNPTAFSRSMDTMLTKLQVREAVKTDGYRGFQVHTLKIPPLINLQYAITDQLVVLGIGDDSAPLTRAILDQEVRVRDGAALGDFPEGVAERLDLAPQGWSWASTMRLTDLIDGMVQVLNETGMVPEQVRPMVQMVLGLLKDFKLEDMVSVGGFDNDKLTVRTIW